MRQPDTQNDFLRSTVLTVVFSTIAFALFHAGLVNYGLTFFIMMPIVIGFFLGQRPRWGRMSFLGLLVGVVAFMYLLLSTQLEGLFCVITLLPLIIVVMMIGVWIGYAVRKYLDGRNDPNKTLKLSVVPLILLLFSGAIEHFFTERYDHGRVESTLVLPYTPMQVYNAIKSVDTLDTQKPLLLHLGLSTPQKCVLEKEAVGAARTCYFADGVIEERVTELRPGEILRMDVLRYGLPGRKWLKFEEAIYLFTPVAGGTKLTRITTYRTELKPRWYWGFWERKAIEAEHSYVLRDLEQRMARH